MRFRKVTTALTLILAVIGFMFAVAQPASAVSASSTAVNFYAGYFAPGDTKRSCFNFNNHAQVGPVAVSATARNYNVIITVVSTDLEYRSGYGWVYCTTLQNASSIGSDVDVAARANLTAGFTFNGAQGSLNAGEARRSCFNFNGRTMTGPLAVSAVANASNVILRTVSTDLENRLNYGWVYCATIRNVSASAASFTLMAKSALGSSNAFNYYAGYLAAGAYGRYCFNYPATAVPVAVTAAASDYNAILTTVHTDRENRFNYGLVYCATIRNASAFGTGVNLKTIAGL